MISRITDLKVSLYFAAISASTAFVQREASIYGTSFAIVLALWRSLAKALWQFLSERTSKNHSRVRILPGAVYRLRFQFCTSSSFALKPMLSQALTSLSDSPPFQWQKQQSQRRGKDC